MIDIQSAAAPYIWRPSSTSRSFARQIEEDQFLGHISFRGYGSDRFCNVEFAESESMLLPVCSYYYIIIIIIIIIIVLNVYIQLQEHCFQRLKSSSRPMYRSENADRRTRAGNFHGDRWCGGPENPKVQGQGDPDDTSSFSSTAVTQTWASRSSLHV
jgi:hypothetical protein